MSRPRNWPGMEVRPYSRLDNEKPVKVDRTQVRYYEDVYGRPHYLVEGGVLGINIWHPLAPPTEDRGAAWALKNEFDKRIERAAEDDADAERTWRREMRGEMEEA